MLPDGRTPSECLTRFVAVQAVVMSKLGSLMSLRHINPKEQSDELVRLLLILTWPATKWLFDISQVSYRTTQGRPQSGSLAYCISAALARNLLNIPAMRMTLYTRSMSAQTLG